MVNRETETEYDIAAEEEKVDMANLDLEQLQTDSKEALQHQLNVSKVICLRECILLEKHPADLQHQTVQEDEENDGNTS